LTAEPHLVLEPLADRMRALAASERFEEAAAVRDRAGAFAAAIAQQRNLRMVHEAGRFEVETETGDRIVLTEAGLAGPQTRAAAEPQSLDEALCIARWLDRNAERVRLVDIEGRLCSPLPALPDFIPRS
jgi:hypothetical protein